MRGLEANFHVPCCVGRRLLAKYGAPSDQFAVITLLGVDIANESSRQKFNFIVIHSKVMQRTIVQKGLKK